MTRGTLSNLQGSITNLRKRMERVEAKLGLEGTMSVASDRDELEQWRAIGRRISSVPHSVMRGATWCRVCGYESPCPSEQAQQLLESH